LTGGCCNHWVHLSFGIEPISLPLQPIFVKELYQNLDLLSLYLGYEVVTSDAYQDALHGAINSIPPFPTVSVPPFQLPGTTLQNEALPVCLPGPNISHPTPWQLPPFSMQPPYFGPTTPSFPANPGFELPDIFSSSRLDRNLGGRPGDHMEAHHLIPQALSTHGFVQRATRAGWDQEAAYNGILLPDNQNLSRRMGLPFQQGHHPQYSALVERGLNDLLGRAEAEGWSDARALQGLQNFTRFLRGHISSMKGGSRLE
jgi:hypothetical protein